MIDPSNVPVVQPDETLARYILYGRYIRNDQSIRADAFIPHPYDQLSVTRHLQATEDELWDVGTAIAAAQQRPVHGRGDVVASAFVERQLQVHADPIVDNPKLPPNANHANVKGWPRDDKGKQRLLAIEIANVATLVRPPGG